MGPDSRLHMLCRYAPYVLCRNPNVWEDPDAFKPSRFLKNVERKHVLSSNRVDDRNKSTADDDDDDEDGGAGATSSLHKPANVSDFE